jgi:hypothetical protein
MMLSLAILDRRYVRKQTTTVDLWRIVDVVPTHTYLPIHLANDHRRIGMASSSYSYLSTSGLTRHTC